MPPAAKRVRRKPVKKVKRKKKPAPLLVRNSELSNWDMCPWLWDRSYVKRLKPIQEGPALRFGTLVHAALEERYPKGVRRGPHPVKTFERLYAENLKEAEDKWGMFADDEWTDAHDLGVYMLEGFVEKYGKDEEWEVIASEMTFQVPVYLPEDFTHPLLPLLNLSAAVLTGQEPLFYFVGTMDGVWRNRMDKRIRVIDYKTTKNDAEKEGQGKLKLDEQTNGYWSFGCDWLINELVLKARAFQALDGMLFTFLRKAKRDDREQDEHGYYLNNDGTRSKKQPSPRFHRELVYRSEFERENYRLRVLNKVVTTMAARAGIFPISKTPKTGTNGHCGWCPQRDVCELHEANADWETLSDVTMTSWDPYDAHEIKWAENR